LEIEIHFPLDCDGTQDVTATYPEKARNMMATIYERIGGGSDKQYRFVTRQKDVPHHIRILLEEGESFEVLQSTLNDIARLYPIDYFGRLRQTFKTEVGEEDRSCRQ
jgi:hypothetical protein